MTPQEKFDSEINEIDLALFRLMIRAQDLGKRKGDAADLYNAIATARRISRMMLPEQIRKRLDE